MYLSLSYLLVYNDETRPRMGSPKFILGHVTIAVCRAYPCREVIKIGKKAVC